MWLVYAFATIIAYVGLDFFIKKASGKIDDFAGAFLINLFALIPVLLIYIWLKVTNHSMLFFQRGCNVCYFCRAVSWYRFDHFYKSFFLGGKSINWLTCS